MNNRFFPAAHLNVLMQPQRWRLVGPGTREPAPTLEADARHLSWSAGHGHLHAHREVLIGLHGETFVGVGGETYPCWPGSVFLFDAEEQHDLNYPPFSPDLDHLWLSLLGGHVFANLMRVRDGRGDPQRLTALALPARPDPLDPVAVWWQSWRDPREPAALLRLRLYGALVTLVAALIEAGYQTADTPDPAHVQQEIIGRICDHIRDTAGRGVNLDGLARAAGYSRFHFLRLFKQHAGVSVHHYVDLCRERRVRDMLDQGIPKKEIAYSLGFSCPAAFSRWYRQHGDAIHHGAPPHIPLSPEEEEAETAHPPPAAEE